MIEIEELPLESWLQPLKPYQQKYLCQLVSLHGEEKAAEIWLDANGPIQTSTFGGGMIEPNKPSLWNQFKKEFDKLICGHPDYEKEQEKFLSKGRTIGLAVVAEIAEFLASILHVSSSLILPALVLILSTVAKMTVKAYCALK